MNIAPELWKRFELAVERLNYKAAQVRRAHPTIKLGETGAPAPADYVEDDLLRSKVNTEWPTLIDAEKSEVARIVDEILDSAPKTETSKFTKLGPNNLWVWGGPTPYWGGSMADDTLVRGAKYFGADNVVYVYGPTTEKMLSLHASFKHMLCQVNSNCRTPGAQEGLSDEENAERLSKLSLQYPNILGAICDDVTSNFLRVVLPEPFEARARALKKYNSALKMYGVVYVHELQRKDFSNIQPYMDVVNLWFWHMDEILEYDKHIQQCRKYFPGKKIVQGIFLHEYGISDSGNLPRLLTYQLDKAREYMTKGIVEGVIILGDREIKKWPQSAETVRNYILNQ